MKSQFNISDFYTKKIMAPSGVKFIHTLAMTAVNSVAIANGQAWSDVVKCLIEQAHLRSHMPDYKTCITDMLRANGFSPLRHHRCMISELLSQCMESGNTRSRYIVKKLYGGYFALIPDEHSNCYALMGSCPKCDKLCDGILDEIWRYIPGTDNRIGLPRKGKTRATEKSQNRLFVKNVNPINREIGDCAVRALSGAYECSWDDAIDYIADATDFLDPHLSSTENIDSVLSKLGFMKHKPVKQNGKFLSGNDFCEYLDRTYHDGERIFAYIGKSHCVAVLPFEQEDKSLQYKIQDTWDCTKGYISDYWIYSKSNMSRDIPLCTRHSFSCGSKVQHPCFGEGTVLSVAVVGNLKMLEIDFGSHDVKKISEAWLLERKGGFNSKVLEGAIK